MRLQFRPTIHTNRKRICFQIYGKNPVNYPNRMGLPGREAFACWIRTQCAPTVASHLTRAIGTELSPFQRTWSIRHWSAGTTKISSRQYLQDFTDCLISSMECQPQNVILLHPFSGIHSSIHRLNQVYFSMQNSSETDAFCIYDIARFRDTKVRECQNPDGVQWDCHRWGPHKKNDGDVDRRRRVSARVCDCVSNRAIEADWVQFIKHCYIMQLQRQKEKEI